jgi:hypothetical protein
MWKTASLLAASMCVSVPAAVLADPPDQVNTQAQAAQIPSGTQFQSTPPAPKPRGVAQSSPQLLQGVATSEVLKTAPPLTPPSSSGPKPGGPKPRGVAQSSPQLFQGVATSEVLKPAGQTSPKGQIMPGNNQVEQTNLNFQRIQPGNLTQETTVPTNVVANNTSNGGSKGKPPKPKKK